MTKDGNKVSKKQIQDTVAALIDARFNQLAQALEAGCFTYVRRKFPLVRNAVVARNGKRRPQASEEDVAALAVLQALPLAFL